MLACRDLPCSITHASSMNVTGMTKFIQSHVTSHALLKSVACHMGLDELSLNLNKVSLNLNKVQT